MSRPVYLSAIADVHGEPRDLADLGELMPVDLRLPEHGLARFRVSELDVWQLASAAAEQTRARSNGDADLLLYSTENDRTKADSLARIARHLTTPHVKYLAISGHDCGNLGPALGLAINALHAGGHRRVMLVIADCAASRSRLMPTGLSVFSDGGAACMITREHPDVAGAVFKVHDVTTRAAADIDASDPGRFIVSTVGLAEAGMKALLERSGRARGDYGHVMFANYRISSQRFLTAAMGFPPARLLLGPIAEYAHSLSADLLANLERFAGSGELGPGERVLASATGPYSWSIVDLENVS